MTANLECGNRTGLRGQELGVTSGKILVDSELSNKAHQSEMKVETEENPGH